MNHSLPLTEIPGLGAERPSDGHIHGASRYVYAARSRRSGGLSLGVDLTPHGLCSFACIYCQAEHPPRQKHDVVIDCQLLENELTAVFHSPDASDLKDLVLAGSGEPTSVNNILEALTTIRRVCDTHNFQRPLRIFSNGRHLHDEQVRAALQFWNQKGGELWIKLDATSPAHSQLINGRSFDLRAHLDHIWSLAKAFPIGLQSMFVVASDLPAPKLLADEILAEVKNALQNNAQIHSWHLLTLRRSPSDVFQAARLHPVPLNELQSFAQSFRLQTQIPVECFA
jgi:uncharacterized Fe-S cluster-containing radical SAM superfamily enzyme